MRAFIVGGFCALSAACSQQGLPHVIDRATTRVCYFSEHAPPASEVATLLIPSAVIVAPYRLPEGFERSAWPSIPPNPCQGPARLLLLPGRPALNVWVQTKDGEAELEPELKLAAAELYELRIRQDGDVITWELIRPAQQ